MKKHLHNSLRALFLSLAVLLSLPMLAEHVEINGINYELVAKAKHAIVIAKSSGEYSGEVVIPESVEHQGTTYSVTSIGDWAFEDCFDLTSVTIPNSVTSIGDYAFCLCVYLTSVTIGNSVKSIGKEAFYWCYSLTSVTIPNSVTSIGELAFYNCDGLTSVTIGNSVKSIGEYAFDSCSGLQDIYCYAENVPSTNSNAFSSSPIADATLHVPAASINSYKATAPWSGFGNIVALPPFSGEVEINGINYELNGETKQAIVIAKSSGLYSDEVVIPESVEHQGTTYSVTSIGGNAFAFCDGLTSVTIPNSVTSIGESAFYACLGLTSVTIPNSVTSIGESAFDDCTGLTSVTIPNSVTSIGQGAFGNCFGLTSVHISDIAAWCNIEFGNISSNPLSSASHLYLDGKEVKDLVIPNSVTSIGKYAFYRCSGLTSITIPNSVTSIGNDAFNGCSGLTSVSIGSGVTSIGDNAFAGCDGLTSVTIPNSVTSIGEWAFEYCSGLTSVTIPNSVTSIGTGAFGGCSGLTEMKVDTNNSKYDSRENCNAIIETSSNTLISGCQTTVIPNSVTSIGEWAFCWCFGLTSVTIPNSVTSIGEGAFWCCSGLTSVTIPNSVTSIGGAAFWCCSGLTSVTIPNSVTYIGEEAFWGCDGLTSVTIPNSVTSIEDYAFSSCSGLQNVYCYAENVPSTHTYAFDDSNYENATLHVPAGSIESYKNTGPWSGFGTIKALPQAMTIVDGEKFENGEEQTLSTLTYTRTLPNLKWNALYVPFEIPVAEIADKYEVAYINNINSYDYDDDGSIDNMSMEIIKIKSGTLKANYPYMIKASNEEAKNMSITLENTTLYPTVSRSIDCSSVYARHEVTGIYDRMYQSELPEGAMAISVNGVWQPIASGSYLNPFRLYMTITARDGSPVKVEPAALSRIRISVLGEDEMETGVEETENGNRKTEKVILDLSGRRVQNPTRGGVYIINGKKMVY